MKVALVGCGAMGSIYAGLLAAAGHEVLAIDHSAEHVEAMNRRGLRVEGASGDRTVPVRATTSVPHEDTELVVIATKAAQARRAAEDALALLAPGTAVLTIQNGLGASREVADVVGADRLAVGIAGGFGASRRGPGHIHHTAMKIVRVGSYGNLPSDRIEEVAATWRGAGFDVETVADVAAMQWEKLICNVAFSGPCALTGLTVAEAIGDTDVRPVCLAAATEAWEVARSLGVEVAIEDPVAHVLDFAAAVGDARPSVLQDLEAGRRSEIGVINGAVPREAGRIDMDAPVNATITALVRQREAAAISRGRRADGRGIPTPG